MAEKTTHELTIPAGPVAAKYKDFVYNEDFKEMAFIGPFNTAKSSALVDWLIMSGLEYPGANLVLTRAALSDLRRTTMTKYLSRAGKVLVEDFNKREAVIEFPEVQGLKSTLYMFGLDRHDLTEVLKSFEPFRAAVEESNEVPTNALDLLLGRVRQKVEHRNRTKRWQVGKMASQWNVSFDAAQYYLGFKDSELDDRMQGKNQLKHVFNPGGNEPMWKRMVGVPYPSKEEMGPEWARENINIREFKHAPDAIKSFTWDAGQIAEWGDPPQREFVGKDLGSELELVTGVRIPKAGANFIGQRGAIFAFPHENWSRNIQADENFLYMDNPEIREQFFEAKFDTTKGLVFPQFDRTVHVVPDPQRDVPRGLRGIISVDQGYRHPTVALFGVLVHRPPGGFLVLKEYMVTGRSAMDNAYQVAGLAPPYMEEVTYWADPSMWRTEATSLRSVADEYLEAGVPLLKADNQIEYTINAVQELLRPVPDLKTGEETPRLFICESCKNLIHAMETTMHDHMTSSRDNWMVDMVDAVRYLGSGIYNQAAIRPQQGPPPHHVRVWDWN